MFFLPPDQWIFKSCLKGKIWTGSLAKESLKKRFTSAEPDLIHPSRQTLSALRLTFAATFGPGDVKVLVKRRVGAKKEKKSLEISLLLESFEANQPDLKVNSRTHNAPAAPGTLQYLESIDRFSGVDIEPPRPQQSLSAAQRSGRSTIKPACVH